MAYIFIDHKHTSLFNITMWYSEKGIISPCTLTQFQEDIIDRTFETFEYEDTTFFFVWEPSPYKLKPIYMTFYNYDTHMKHTSVLPVMHACIKTPFDSRMRNVDNFGFMAYDSLFFELDLNEDWSVGKVHLKLWNCENSDISLKKRTRLPVKITKQLQAKPQKLIVNNYQGELFSFSRKSLEKWPYALDKLDEAGTTSIAHLPVPVSVLKNIRDHIAGSQVEFEFLTAVEMVLTTDIHMFQPLVAQAYQVLETELQGNLDNAMTLWSRALKAEDVRLREYAARAMQKDSYHIRLCSEYADLSLEKRVIFWQDVFFHPVMLQ